ncbi:unnamed protein product [Cuscuta campestris]|uniref:Uncharacterized protein n=1 Tax=Cuscuta campestris TaxID=132261 RepID=A0A484LS74_9ASTE|nr:unnamed protein product [Cuscuta campestris]
MEGGASAKVKIGRWKKQRGYRRINEVAGEARRSKRRFWRIPARFKLRLNLRFSPKKLLIRIRDAYVKMMLRIANSPGVAGFAGGGAPGFGARELREYDEKMLVQIYRSLLVSQSQADKNCLPPVMIPIKSKD